MQYAKLRKHRRRERWFEGVLSHNPVFMGGLALPFAVMITTNLKNAAGVSAVFACSLLPPVLLAAVVGKRLPRWGLYILCTLLSMALVIASMPLIPLISPEVGDSLGIYVPILAVNSILLTLCERHARNERRPLLALADGVSYSAGFALALCLIAALREYFGNGTLWNIPLPSAFHLRGIRIAFAGFLLTGFFCALFRFARRTTLCLAVRRIRRHEAQSSPLS